MKKVMRPSRRKERSGSTVAEKLSVMTNGDTDRSLAHPRKIRKIGVCPRLRPVTRRSVPANDQRIAACQIFTSSQAAKINLAKVLFQLAGTACGPAEKD